MGAVATVMEKFLKLEKKDLSILSFFTQMTIIGWKVSVVSVNRNAGFPKGCGRLVVGGRGGGVIWAKWPKTAWKLQNWHFWVKTVGVRHEGGGGGDKHIHTVHTYTHTVLKLRVKQVRLQLEQGHCWSIVIT